MNSGNTPWTFAAIFAGREITSSESPRFAARIIWLAAASALTGAAFGFEADSFFVDEGNRPRLGQAIHLVARAAIRAGANTAGGVAFDLDDRRASRDEALRRANREETTSKTD